MCKYADELILNMFIQYNVKTKNGKLKKHDISSY